MYQGLCFRRQNWDHFGQCNTHLDSVRQHPNWRAPMSYSGLACRLQDFASPATQDFSSSNSGRRVKSFRMSGSLTRRIDGCRWPAWRCADRGPIAFARSEAPGKAYWFSRSHLDGFFPLHCPRSFQRLRRRRPPPWFERNPNPGRTPSGSESRL